MSDVTSGSIQWLPAYNQKLHIISAALLSAGIIYLIAANWLAFPAAIQLAIPQVLLVIASALTVYFSPSTLKGHCCAAFAALMIGLSFASYGQIYQTGADSFQLFAVWTVLLLPWLYFRLSAIYSLFYITLSLTYYLADQQWLALDNSLFWLGFSALLFGCLLIAHYFCQGSRLILLLLTAGISIFAMVINLFEHYDSNLSIGVMSIIYLLPLLIAGFFYLQKWPAGIAIAILLFAFNTTFQFIKSIILHSDGGAALLLIIAMVIVLWCWFLSKLLQFFIPNNLNWSSLPAFLGAWIASLLFAGGFYILFESVILLFSLMLMIVGFIFIRRQNASLFVHQLSFAMTLCGQALLFSEFAGSYFRAEENTLLIIQTIIVALSWYLSPSQIWRTIQCLILVSLYRIFTQHPIELLVFIPFIIWLIAPAKFAQANWRRPLLCGLIAAVVLFNVTFFLNSYSHSIDLFFFHFNIFHIISLILFSAIYVVIFRRINIILMLLFIALSVLLLMVNLFGVLAILLALMLISPYQDKLMNVLLMTALTFCLFVFYYSLDIPLIQKGMIIIASGILVSLLSFFNDKLLKGAHA